MIAGDDSVAPKGRLAILHPPGRMGLKTNPFGKDVANLQLWRALARHGGYERLDVLSYQPVEPEAVAADLFEGAPGATRIGAAPLLNARGVLAEAGTLLRGQPHLAELAWMRRRGGAERTYSLAGLVHTLAPPAVRQGLAGLAVAPTHPWDALICTSPAVRDGLERLFDGMGEHLATRTGGRAPPRMALPVIPLGVDADRLAAAADRPGARDGIRARLGLGADDILILWVGRLSYFEKAFPQPMFQAVQQASRASGRRLTFVMAGWFPSDQDRGRYEEAARRHAPEVAVGIVDGNDRALLDDLWAGSDIFLSLVDNIQETFGITPLEAMAAGLPVVASDWDGYRATVREGIEGFLIPTLLGPSAGRVGETLADRHALETLTYQAYAGAVAQHTAVHIGRAARALEALAVSPELRRRMGAAGRARVREAFDWPVVARQIHALTDELGAIRAAATDPSGRGGDPAREDPFQAFAGFASATVGHGTRLAAPPGVTAQAVRLGGRIELDAAFPALRATPEQCAAAFEFIVAQGGAASVRDILLAFPAPERRKLEMGLAWMAKYGFVDWLA